MSIRRLQILIAVAERGSFAGAADAILISPSAVSQQIRKLEEEMRIELFDRRARPPTLNRDGLALVPKAKEIVAAYEAMIRSVGDGETPSGELELGAIPTTLNELVPETIKRLRESHPLLHFRVAPDLSAELMAQVDRGALDGALISEPDRVSTNLTFRSVAVEPLVLLTNRAVEGDDPVSILAAHPFIRFTRRAWIGRDIEDWLTAKKVQVREVMELDRPDAIVTMVHHGLGVAIIPGHSVPAPFLEGVRRIPLGASATPRAIGLIHRSDTEKGRPLDLLAETLEAVARERDEASPLS